MVLGPVGRVLGVPQLPLKVLTVLGHPKVFIGPARGILGRFKFPGHMQSVLRLVNAADHQVEAIPIAFLVTFMGAYIMLVKCPAY